MTGADSRAVLEAAAEAIGARSLRPVGAPLRGSQRTVVIRAAVDGGPGTVVVKAFAPNRAGEGWVREAAALAVLRGRGARAADLLEVGSEPPFVVTADLGDGPNLADALLGADPEAAAEALGDWAEALATVHRSTVASAPAYADALAVHAGDLPVDVETTSNLLDTAAATLQRLLPELGVRPSPVALHELREAGAMLGADATALSPTDACPDNNVRTSKGLVLLDLEGAEVRHVAWDVAYLRVPWPSCWCSWRLPADVADPALARWRAGARAAFPVVDSAVFDAALDVASTAWALLSVSWFLDRALGADPPPEDPRLHGLVPSRRAMIQHRLDGAVRRDTPKLPTLTRLADEALGATRAAWGDTPLALAPAFRSQPHSAVTPPASS